MGYNITRIMIFLILLGFQSHSRVKSGGENESMSLRGWAFRLTARPICTIIREQNHKVYRKKILATDDTENIKDVGVFFSAYSVSNSEFRL